MPWAPATLWAALTDEPVLPVGKEDRLGVVQRQCALHDAGLR